VIGLVEYPLAVKKTPGGRTEPRYPIITSDILPTVLDILGLDSFKKRPLDGISLLLLPCASFAPNCWDTAALRSFGDFCAAAFGVAPPFGRMNMQAARLGGDGGVCGWSKNALSRVVFTNGALDPWSYGGVSAVNASSACAPPAAMIVIEGAAHHYDLRTPLATDPPAVVAAREEVITMITKWLDDDKDKDERWSPS
jgi:hypothetical protein